MTQALELNEKALERIKDNDPLLITQGATNSKVELPVDYPEDEDSDVLKKVMQDLAQF